MSASTAARGAFPLDFPPRRRQRMLAAVLAAIRALPAERSRGRHNPRVVKRKMSNVPTRSRAAASERRRWCDEDHIHILPPAGQQPLFPTTPEPASAAGPPTITVHQHAATPERHHVKAWRASTPIVNRLLPPSRPQPERLQPLGRPPTPQRPAQVPQRSRCPLTTRYWAKAYCIA